MKIREIAPGEIEPLVQVWLRSVRATHEFLSEDDIRIIDPDHIGCGGGKLMLAHARELKGPLVVDVNEQNPAALGFYLANGFEVIGRSPTDTAGRPFPLIHLREVVGDA